MDKRKLVIGVVVLLVLVPTWYVAAHGEPPSEEVRIDQSVSEVRPLEGPVDAPNKLSPAQVGVIVWVGLFALVGILAGFHRFMNRAARPGNRSEPAPDAAATDGGTPTFPWLQTADRWVVRYEDASDAIEGLVAMGGLTVLTITFAGLFTAEYLTLARTQFFGIYMFGLFMSLTGLTVSYYAWFMPHVEVAERRDH